VLPLLQGGEFQQAYSLTAKSKTAMQDREQRPARVKSARRREDLDAAMEGA